MIGMFLPENSALINQIILLVKRYVYVTKCKGFKNVFKHCYYMEKEIANAVDNIGKPKSKSNPKVFWINGNPFIIY